MEFFVICDNSNIGRRSWAGRAGKTGARECFALTCSNCRREVEIPAVGEHICPLCLASLLIQWEAS
jgi:hypothetical protein